MLNATLSIVLLSMVSFVFQPCTGNERRLSFNGKASILLSSSKISQLTNVHNKSLQVFLSLPVYFSFFNFKILSFYQMP